MLSRVGRSGKAEKTGEGGRTLGKLKHFDENSEEKFFKALPSPFGAVIAVGVAIGLINLIAMMLEILVFNWL